MNVTISSVAGLLVLLAAIALGGGLLWGLAVPASRLRARAGGLRGREGLRVEAAVRRYNFWLDWYDVPRRRRRDLRDDLRANLWGSAQDAGAKAAIGRLGPVRALAREAALADPARYERPRWGFGVSMGILAAGHVIIGQLFLALAWMDGAHASGVARVASSTPLLPGSSIEYTHSAGGFGVEASIGYLFVIAFGLAFLLAARPWRLARRPVSPVA
jgi:hypothetical protein